MGERDGTGGDKVSASLNRRKVQCPIATRVTHPVSQLAGFPLSGFTFATTRTRSSSSVFLFSFILFFSPFLNN